MRGHVQESFSRTRTIELSELLHKPMACLIPIKFCLIPSDDTIAQQNKMISMDEL